MNWQKRDLNSNFVDQNRTCLYQPVLFGKIVPKYLGAGNASSGV
jgi:hypothetical protein